MDIAQAQGDLRRAYFDGGPGTAISGAVWIVAAVVQRLHGVEAAFVALFFGAWLIYPLSLLVRRLGGRTAEAKDNPGGRLVVESTIAMVAMLFAAWLLLPFREALVMPLAAMAVGTHYFAFRTAYGDRTFYVLAAILTLIGLAGVYRFVAVPGGVAVLVGLVELAFGGMLTVRSVRALPA